MVSVGRGGVLGVVALALSLSACSASGTQQSPATPNRGSAPGGEAIVQPPLEGLRKQVEANRRDIHEAIERATVVCMRERGFTYTPNQYRDREVETRRVGDLEYAKREGLGVVAAMNKPKVGPPSNPDEAGKTPEEVRAYSVALIGEPIGPMEQAGPDIIKVEFEGGAVYYRKGSCSMLATEQIGGEEWIALDTKIQDLTNEVRRKTNADPRFVQLKEKWTKCMAGAGHATQDLNEQADHLARALSDRTMTQEQVKAKEIAIATASAQCEIDIDMVRGYPQIQADIERQVLDANQGFVTRWAEMNADAAKKAKDYLRK